MSCGRNIPKKPYFVRNLKITQMKKLLFFAGLIGLIATGCSSSDDSSGSVTAANVISTVTQGTWRVTLFSEDGNDHTSDFTGYGFTFTDSGVLTAANGTNTYNGEWLVTNGSDDDNPSDIDFYVFFASPAAFAELTEDYTILERTSTKIRLRHVSGGNGGTDLLTFQKN